MCFKEGGVLFPYISFKLIVMLLFFYFDISDSVMKVKGLLVS